MISSLHNGRNFETIAPISGKNAIMGRAPQILEFRVTGEANGKPLAPGTISMGMFRDLVADAMDFVLGGGGSKEERDQFLREVHFSVEQGSFMPRFVIPALLAASAVTTELNADLEKISQGSLDIAPKRVDVLSRVKRKIQQDELLALTIGGTWPDGRPLAIAIGRETDLTQHRPALVDVEEYVSARVVDMGGMTPNVHLVFDDGSRVTASASMEFLKELEKNYLYKEVVAHIIYRHNPRTKQNSDHRVLDIGEQAASLDMEAFERAIEEGTKLWADVPDHVAWVREMRGAVHEQYG